jgi:hypothetical protein
MARKYSAWRARNSGISPEAASRSAAKPPTDSSVQNRGSGRIVAALQQALVQQAVQRAGVRLAHRLGGVQRAARGEHRQSPEQGLLGPGEQVMAPFDGRAQRPVPGLGITRAGEQVEPGTDPVQQLRGGEDAQPGGRQLQRQRQPVQPRAQPVHHRRRLDQDPGGRGALPQQRGRIAGGQRRHREHALRRQLQPLAAGGQHHQLLTRRQQPGHHVSQARQQVLGVVQQDQHPAPLEPGQQRLLQAGSFFLPHTQCLRQRAQNLLPAAHRRQTGPPQPTRERIRHPGSGGQRLGRARAPPPRTPPAAARPGPAHQPAAGPCPCGRSG